MIHALKQPGSHGEEPMSGAEAAEFARRIAEVEGRLARLEANRVESAPEAPQSDNLTTDEALQLLRRSRSWLHRYMDELADCWSRPGGTVGKDGREKGALRWSRKALERWLENQR